MKRGEQTRRRTQVATPCPEYEAPRTGDSPTHVVVPRSTSVASRARSKTITRTSPAELLLDKGEPRRWSASLST